MYTITATTEQEQDTWTAKDREAAFASVRDAWITCDDERPTPTRWHIRDANDELVGFAAVDADNRWTYIAAIGNRRAEVG